MKNARTAQVRQLEALVRVSEALSKTRLSAEVSSRDVREVSTSSAVATDQFGYTSKRTRGGADAEAEGGADAFLPSKGMRLSNGVRVHTAYE